MTANEQRLEQARQALAEASALVSSTGVAQRGTNGRAAGEAAPRSGAGVLRNRSNDTSQDSRSNDTLQDGGSRDTGSDRRHQNARGHGSDPAEARARQVVLRQLAMAPRSRFDLQEKLRARGIDDAVAARVLDRFAEVGLVDDEAFAEVLVHSQQASRGLSRRALAHRLRQKGVDAQVAADALAAVGPESERARAEDLVAARLTRLAGLPREVQMRRLAGMLARKGYEGDLAYSVIRQALDTSAEHARD